FLKCYSAEVGHGGGCLAGCSHGVLKDLRLLVRCSRLVVAAGPWPQSLPARTLMCVSRSLTLTPPWSALHDTASRTYRTPRRSKLTPHTCRMTMSLSTS